MIHERRFNVSLHNVQAQGLKIFFGHYLELEVNCSRCYRCRWELIQNAFNKGTVIIRASIRLHCLRTLLAWLAGVGHEFSTGEIMYSCLSANLIQELEASHVFLHEGWQSLSEELFSSIRKDFK